MMMKVERESGIAKALNLVESSAYDNAVKAFLSHKLILAQILKACVEEFVDCSPLEIAGKYIEGEPEVSTTAVDRDSVASKRIVGMNTEDATTTEGEIRFDIRFRASVPGEKEQINLIINLEAQKNDSPGYSLVKRGTYYCARLLSAQKNVVFFNSDYGKLNKVYSIWICYSSPSYPNTITRYFMQKEDVVGHTGTAKKNYDLMQLIILRLGDREESELGSILRMLDVAFSDDMNTEEKKEVLREEYQIPMTESLEGRLVQMCNISEGVREQAFRKGEKKGREEGRLEIILSLVRDGILPPAMAAARLSMTEDEFRKLAAT